MNYGRIRKQAALNKKIKEALFEKSDALRSMSGSERQKAEDLIIKKVKEGFMGFKNAKNKEQKPELENGAGAEQSGQESNGTEKGSDQSGSDEQGSSEDGQEQGSSEEDAQSSSEDSSGSEETQDGSDDKSELDGKEIVHTESGEVVSIEEAAKDLDVNLVDKKLEEMNEEELRKYAEEKGIDLGNSTSINGMLKKINNQG